MPIGPDQAPAIQLLRWMRAPIPFLEECARRYGDTFTLRLLGNPPMVAFSDPAAIREIFTGDPDDLHAGEGNDVLEPIVGSSSLLLLDGERHQRERKLMVPPFHGERMRAYGEAMRTVADRVIDALPLGRPFAIHTAMQEITLDVILRTVFGIAEGPRLVRMRELLTRYTTLGTSPLGTAVLLLLPRGRAKRIIEGTGPLQVGPFSIDVARFLPWGKINRSKRDVDELLYDELATRRRGGDQAGIDVLSMLMAARDEHGAAMSDVELRDEMITLLLAGHETSATTMAWTVHHVLGAPAVLAAIRAERSRIAGDGPLAPDQIPRLEYLDAVIKETLRLTPILPFVARRLMRPMRLGGHDLPEGVRVIPSIWLTHHRADLWPDPTRFDPSRFVGVKADPYQYFPFGGGSRRCLGMAFANYEMKIVLSQLFARAELAAAPGPAVTIQRRGITLAPSGGVPVIMTRSARAARA